MNIDTFLKFKELLNFVFENKYSDFYKEKFEKAGFNPSSDFKSKEDIKKIPFLTREELVNTDPFKLLFVSQNDVSAVGPTSGTTGKPFFVFRYYDDPTIYSSEKPDWGRMLFLVNPIRGEALKRFFPGKTNRLAITGDIYNLPLSCQLAARLGVNTIYTTPTLAIILKDYLDKYPELKQSLKYFNLSGEMIASNKNKLIKELYPNLGIFISYGISEAGGVGFQCKYLAESKDQVYFHTRTKQYFEVINPGTEESVELGEKGELVLTNFKNLATPFIRYKTGDLVILRENNCPCGAPGYLLELFGRANYDSVKAGGFMLEKTMIEKPILNLMEYIDGDFEAHIYENFVGTKPKIKIVLSLSLKDGVEETPELKKIVADEFLKNWQLSSRLNLEKAVGAGLFEPIQINFVKFPKSAKSKGVLILH